MSCSGGYSIILDSVRQPVHGRRPFPYLESPRNGFVSCACISSTAPWGYDGQRGNVAMLEGISRGQIIERITEARRVMTEIPRGLEAQRSRIPLWFQDIALDFPVSIVVKYLRTQATLPRLDACYSLHACTSYTHPPAYSTIPMPRSG